MTGNQKVVFVILFAVLIIASLALQGYTETGRHYYESLYEATIIYTTSWSGAASNDAMITGVTGRSIVVTKIIFSSANATSLYLNDSGTNADVGYGYLRVIAGASEIDNEVNLKCDSGATLYGTTGNAAEIHLEYVWE